MPSSASGQFPRGPHHVPDLGVLISRQFVHDITHLVVPTSLHRLLAAEYLLDARPQRFGSVDHEQALLIGSESAFAQADQPLLSGGRVLDGSDLDPQNMLVAGPIHTHSADDVMITEALPIDVDCQ